MALSDIKTFLEDILLRFDPDIDVSQGSNAETKIINPILTRVGPDPFDNDITTFVIERIRQVYPDIAIAEVDAATDTLVDPMRTLIEPLVREIKLIKLRSSLRNAESLSDDEIDALAANFFKTRQSGGYSRGVVRIYYAHPQSVSVTLVNPATTRAGLRFYPTRPQAVTADQMLLNRDGTEYYVDINYTAESRGTEYDIEPRMISKVDNMPAATRVVNLTRFRDGAARETSLDYLARIESSLGDETLAVARGAVATFSDAFPAAQQLFVVGFRDPEMRRDIVTGGGIGAVPGNDVAGAFYGVGGPIDDLDGDITSPVLDLGAQGNLVLRLGAVGAAPSGWFLSVSYTDGSLVVVDAEILEIVSSDRCIVDHEFPLTLGAADVTWALRRNILTLSDIPGGIALPDNADGELEIVPGQVHIGGKSDVYAAGGIENATAQISSLTDAGPVARGVDAQTFSDEFVYLNDVVPTAIVAGMSVVLEEGASAGSYRIIDVSGALPTILTLDVELTATQSNLSWKVVDTIDVELTDPRDIKVNGADLVTSAGSAVVNTVSSTNFIDAGVSPADILEIEGGLNAGEYTVQVVNATSLEVDPVLPRTIALSAYSVFRRSEAVDPPVVRIKSLELLDSSGAPVGTVIPYANPVLVESRAFQNEGSGFVFDDYARLGLVLGPDFATSTANNDWDWETYNAAQAWDLATGSGTLTFSGGAVDATTVAAEITADPTLSAAGVSAVVLTLNGVEYVGIISTSLVVSLGGTATGNWSSFVGATNAHISSLGTSFTVVKARVGDLVEVVSGNNAGLTSRVIAATSAGQLLLGYGPTGPSGTEGLYDNQVLRPDIGARVRVGRSSVGSGRVYFIQPTSADFYYGTTRFTAEGVSQELVYRPDPENSRVLLPTPPFTTLPITGTASPTQLTDTSQNFLSLGILPGDIVGLIYYPIGGSTLAATPLALSGKVLRLRLETNPYVEVAFPSDLVRQAAADYINEQVGVDVADIDVDKLRLRYNGRLDLDKSAASTALAVLGLGTAAESNAHPYAGEYAVRAVAATALTFSGNGPVPGGTVTESQYRIRRHVQRVSSTEMSGNQDATGLYYVDVEMVAVAPGDQYNIETGVVLESTGHRADGYTLTTGNGVLSFSTAEVLTARISRSILLPGSSDNPSEAVQLSRQNVQVSYERSSMIDEMQAFADSDLQRTLLGEILVRHLLPHYTSLNWVYTGGALEPTMRRELEDWISGVEPGGDELEVGDLTAVLRKNGATSAYTPDASVAAGRRAPIVVVVYHDEDRVVRARVVRDVISTMRLQRFIPDTLTLVRAT